MKADQRDKYPASTPYPKGPRQRIIAGIQGQPQSTQKPRPAPVSPTAPKAPRIPKGSL